MILSFLLFLALIFWVMGKVEKLFPPHQGAPPMASEIEHDNSPLDKKFHE